MSKRFEVRVECLNCGKLWFADVDISDSYGPGSYGVEDQIADHKCKEN